MILESVGLIATNELVNMSIILKNVGLTTTWIAITAILPRIRRFFCHVNLYLVPLLDFCELWVS